MAQLPALAGSSSGSVIPEAESVSEATNVPAAGIPDACIDEVGLALELISKLTQAATTSPKMRRSIINGKSLGLGVLDRSLVEWASRS